MARPDDGRKRAWGFKLNEGAILEESAPNGPTEKQIRRRGRVSLMLGTLVVALMMSAVAFASVSTDQQDYSPGSVVTISGDNGNDAGYVERNTVDVAVSGPNSWTASCSATVEAGGLWSCTVTLLDSLDAVGNYSYTATSTDAEGNAINETGAFTDAVNINSFASDCGTGGESFATGTTVCAKATGLPGGGGGSAGKIEWWAPSAVSATRTSPFSGVSGNFSDSWAPTASPTACGTWTLKVYSPAATFQDDATFAVTGCATNQKPVADTGGPYTGGVEGASVSLDGSGSSDPDAGDTLTYAWSYAVVTADLGTTCAFSDATAVSPTISCTDDGSFTLKLTVTDNHGLASDEATALLTLTNADPSATPSIPSSDVSEGDSFSLSLSSPSDPGSNDTFKYQFDCGDGSGYNAASTTASRSCPTTDNGFRSVKLKVLDDDGGYAEYTGTVNVVNVAPIVDQPEFSILSVDCRTSINLTKISFSDPGVNDYPWTVSIDWGDGSTDTSYTSNTQGAQANQTHTYNTPGGYTATVIVTDKDSGEGSNTSSNTVTVKQAYTVGFRQPIDPSNPTKLVGNSFKSGRVVPVKATIYDVCTQAYVNDPATDVTIVLRDGGVGNLGSNDAVEVFADPGAANSNTLLFRWTSDATVPGGGFWIYNVDSKTVISGTPMLVGHNYRVDIFVGTNWATSSQWAVLTPTR